MRIGPSAGGARPAGGNRGDIEIAESARPGDLGGCEACGDVHPVAHKSVGHYAGTTVTGGQVARHFAG